MKTAHAKKSLWVIGLVILVWTGVWLRGGAPKLSTLIVPHHDLVAAQRAETFAFLQDRIAGRRVILLSPNHYDSAPAVLQTTDQDFTTKNGNLEIDHQLLAIAKDHGAVETPVTFEAEHGVRTILPDIARTIPGTTILPLIMKETVPREVIDELLADLYASCQDCLMIASVDFSHYQPYQLSELHDRLTRRGMQALDRDLLEHKAEVGEPHVLGAAIKWAELNGTRRYEEFNHTNATALTDDYYAEGTTHFYAWYEAGQPVWPDQAISFTFVGDLMFDRTIRQRFHPDYNDVIKQLGDRVLWGSDIVMANLEGPITDQPVVPSEQAKPRFRFSPLIKHTLKDLRFTHLNVRNNHVLDAGQEGFEDTLGVLSELPVTAMHKPAEPQIVTGSGQRIISFSLDAAQNDELTQADLAPYQASSDNIVIYVHWGPEYAQAPSKTQTDQARQWVDWGADLVVGTGAHVLQPVELYKNRPIVYSLGNFIFDMTDDPRTSSGLVLSGVFTEEEIILQPMLSSHHRLVPVLGRSTESDAVVEEYFKDLKPWLQDKRGGLLFSIRK